MASVKLQAPNLNPAPEEKRRLSRTLSSPALFATGTAHRERGLRRFPSLRFDHAADRQPANKLEDSSAEALSTLPEIPELDESGEASSPEPVNSRRDWFSVKGRIAALRQGRTRRTAPPVVRYRGQVPGPRPRATTTTTTTTTTQLPQAPLRRGRSMPELRHRHSGWQLDTKVPPQEKPSHRPNLQDFQDFLGTVARSMGRALVFTI